MRLLLAAGLCAVAATANVPIALPSKLEWRNIGDRDVRTSLQPLLRSSYITTADDDLRLEYTASALEWMLKAPGSQEDLRVGIGVAEEAGLVGFVCAVPSGLQLDGDCHAAVAVSYTHLTLPTICSV